jgi:hypothetical protein
MEYDDGYIVDDNMRVVKCPKCENEIFSDDAIYCKICGTKLFNECEGTPEYDNHGNVIDYIYHNNPGDARFCETCGTPTYFFKTNLLKPWEDVKADIEALNIVNSSDSEDEVAAGLQFDTEEDDELPF